MKSSQFEAKTFGVGELIMQRKLFVVPPHQRSFAWGKEAVEEFLSDVETAWRSGSADYFIGLIVIQGSADGEWILLDGQQRLTTVSLIFSAMRYWMHASGFAEDAKQINHEYLGIRRLGGDYSARMLLNEENRDAFETATAVVPDRELHGIAATIPKRKSNRLIFDAAISTRGWINTIAGERSSTNEEGAKSLYQLARFLDTKLKVVAVEVSSEVDAYVLFEALNDRGVALSALDLIKNYIFSRDSSGQRTWDAFLSALGDGDPEDFLKVFWTSRFGNIQKSQIFRWVKERYPAYEDARLLLAQMRDDAELLSAVFDDDHPYWEGRPEGLRNQVFLMRFLESKQARPVLISILRSIGDPRAAQQMVSILGDSIMRFQVVGKGRTGVVEKIVGRLCYGLHSGEIRTAEEFRATLAELVTSDSEFSSQFSSYVDARYSRLSYVLAEDAIFVAHSHLVDGILRLAITDVERARLVRRTVENTRLVRLTHFSDAYVNADGIDPNVLIGNFALERVGEIGVEDELPSFSVTPLTVAEVVLRTKEIGERAASVWTASPFGEEKSP